MRTAISGCATVLSRCVSIACEGASSEILSGPSPIQMDPTSACSFEHLAALVWQWAACASDSACVETSLRCPPPNTGQWSTYITFGSIAPNNITAAPHRIRRPRRRILMPKIIRTPRPGTHYGLRSRRPYRRFGPSPPLRPGTSPGRTAPLRHPESNNVRARFSGRPEGSGAPPPLDPATNLAPLPEPPNLRSRCCPCLFSLIPCLRV